MLAAVLLAAVVSTQLPEQAPAPAPAPDSLNAAGNRPWHAAETWRRAVARTPDPTAAELLAGAQAQLAALRFDHARSLLVGQPWLADSPAGLGLLGEAELGLGLPESAADRFLTASRGATGAEAALLLVRRAVALEAAGRATEAMASWREARRLGLVAIADWMRLREARLARDTAVARPLLDSLAAGPARESPRVWAMVTLASGDSVRAQAAFVSLGRRRDATRLALSRGDSAAARAALYADAGGRLAREDADVIRELVTGLPPRTASEFRMLGRAHGVVGAHAEALAAVMHALALGDSSGSTLLLAGEASAAVGQLWAAERAYRAAHADPTLAPLAAYRRARTLAALGDAGAVRALAGFADAYPGDTAAPTALYLLADFLAERGDSRADGWYAELLRRYPTDRVASLARFRLAHRLRQSGNGDSATALYRDEVRRGGPQALAARFLIGRTAAAAGDSAGARAEWAVLAAEDSLGYYGLRVRAAAGLAPPRIPSVAALVPPPIVARALARLDTLRLAGLDSEMVTEVRSLVADPPADIDALLALSEGLTERGFGPAGVRLGWMAFGRVPMDPRAVRQVFPWPLRDAVEAEAREFGLDPLLFAALVRQESVFDADAESRAGARGLAQLLPSTAADVARGLDVALEPEWLVIPDLNLHLGAAHFARLLGRFDGRLDAAIAAYNAGATPVRRWLRRPGMADPDDFVELIPYRETRRYVRAVLRNRWLYAALYGETDG